MMLPVRRVVWREAEGWPMSGHAAPDQDNVATTVGKGWRRRYQVLMELARAGKDKLEEEIEKEIAKIKSKKGESNESKIESKKELEDNEDHTNKLTHRHYVG